MTTTNTRHEAPGHIVAHYAAALTKIEAITATPARATELLQTYTHLFLSRAPGTNYTTATAARRLNLPAGDLTDLDRAGVIDATETSRGNTDYYLSTFATMTGNTTKTPTSR